MSHDGGRTLPTLAAVHHPGILFPIPILWCTKQLFPLEPALLARSLHCKQNRGCCQVCDGHALFRNEQTSVSVAGGRLQLVFVAKRPPAGTNLFKSCNCSSLTNKLKKTKMEHKLTFIRSLFCVWVKKNFYRSKCFLFDSCLTHIFIFDCTHTDLPWSSFVCFANTLTFKKIVL